jgi:hypothetical protein
MTSKKSKIKLAIAKKRLDCVFLHYIVISYIDTERYRGGGDEHFRARVQNSNEPLRGQSRENIKRGISLKTVLFHRASESSLQVVVSLTKDGGIDYVPKAKIFFHVQLDAASK